MKKVLFVATVAEHINAFHIPYLKWFKERDWEVHVAARGGCDIPYCDKRHEVGFQRSPFSPDNLRAYRQLKSVINTEQFKLIHCHTPMGGVLGRLCSRKQRKKGLKVIYTAHGFHFYKGAPALNWLVYYPIEKLCSYMTDALITINQEDYALAKNKLRAKSVFFVPGVGVDTKGFAGISIDRERKRAEIGVPTGAVMLLSVGELIRRKNHEVIIRALAGLNNPDIHLCIAGRGELKAQLEALVSAFDIEANVHLLGYRSDADELFKAADIFCFPSYQEGLPVALMEAMASGLPCIVSSIRGNTDLIADGAGGVLVEPGDVSGFAKAIDKLIGSEQLRAKFGENNKAAVVRFDVENAVREMERIYEMV